MTLDWPYNLPIWRSSHEAISSDGKLIASMPFAAEVSMGNPTAGELLLQSGMQVPMCSPSFIWSDDSRYLAAPQFFNRFGFLRRQRLLILDFHTQTAYQSKEIAYYYQPESFISGTLKVIKEPFKTKVTMEFEIPSDLHRFTSISLHWPQGSQQSV